MVDMSQSCNGQKLCYSLRVFFFFFFHFQSVYAPKSGLSDEVKDLFFDQLRAVTAMIPGSKFLIPRGNWNDHVGRAATGYREVYRGMGYGRLESDVEGERNLEYALAFNLLLGNTFQET